MSRRTALPLLAALMGVAACSPQVDDDVVATAGSDPGGAGGLGGTAGQGGAGEAGSGGSANWGDCTAYGPPLVFACLEGPFEGTTDIQSAELEGTVTRVEMAPPESTCFASRAVLISEDHAKPTSSALAIQIADGEGGVWDAAFVVPALTSPPAIGLGDSVELSYRWHDEFRFGGTSGHIVLRHGGVLVVGVGFSEMVDVAVAKGLQTCHRDGHAEQCAIDGYEMEVTVGRASATLQHNTTAQVGDLIITDDNFFDVYDSTGTCNFGHSYLIGAVAAP
jgi:hypothetical protein